MSPRPAAPAVAPALHSAVSQAGSWPLGGGRGEGHSVSKSFPGQKAPVLSPRAESGMARAAWPLSPLRVVPSAPAQSSWPRCAGTWLPAHQSETGQDRACPRPVPGLRRGEVASLSAAQTVGPGGGMAATPRPGSAQRRRSQHKLPRAAHTPQRQPREHPMVTHSQRRRADLSTHQCRFPARDNSKAPQLLLLGGAHELQRRWPALG